MFATDQTDKAKVSLVSLTARALKSYEQCRERGAGTAVCGSMNSVNLVMTDLKESHHAPSCNDVASSFHQSQVHSSVLG